MLADCLASVAAHAEELVVVDMGSTDASPEISAAYGARVLTRVESLVLRAAA